MVEIKVYTKEGCPFCIMAINVFKNYEVEYEEISVDDPVEQRKLISETGHRTVPQIFINNEFLGGCDDLLELKNSGKLDEILSEK